MEASRLLLILCSFLLCICLVFSITALVSLRHAVAETTATRMEAEQLLEDAKEVFQSELPVMKEETTEPTQPADVLYEKFCMRESGGKIAIYTSDGYLVKILETDVSSLPAADREALQQGITLSSWRELLALLEDLTG